MLGSQNLHIFTNQRGTEKHEEHSKHDYEVRTGFSLICEGAEI
jgi:hypothetical protein